MHCRRQPKIYLLVALLGIGLLARFLRYDGLGVAVRAHCLPVQGSHSSRSVLNVSAFFFFPPFFEKQKLLFFRLFFLFGFSKSV
jgi:hypothetical protein